MSAFSDARAGTSAVESLTGTGVFGNVASAGEGATPLAPALANTGDPLGPAAARIKPIPGYTDVAVHGSPDSFWWLRDTTAPLDTASWDPLSNQSVSNYVKSSTDWDGGPIRLISCSTGAPDAVAAQNFANKMGVEVLAPSDTVWIHPSGTLTVGPTQFKNTGSWNSFFPTDPNGGL